MHNMRKLLFGMLALIACNSTPTNKGKQAAEEIAQADIDMSLFASREGFNKALLMYADDSVVKPKDGELPVFGKPALEKYWSGKPDTKHLSWEPFKAEASASGDLGYTLGNWKLVMDDTVLYGNYCTIWKRQADGKWKFTFDAGNNTPKP